MDDEKTYSKQQIMLALCYMSYYGFLLRGNDQKNAKKILQAFNSALSTWRPLKDEWEVVWGPALFALPGTRFDDSLMYVVRNIDDPSQYVVTIRGTNPVSIPNWVLWDFQTKELKSWPFGEAGRLKPMISESTYFGFLILQGLRPERGIPGYKSSLLEFLKAELKDKPDADICITGHSLGGALATVVSLWLTDIQGTELPESAAISAVTIAAPTPGNQDFAAYFNKKLGKRGDRIANSLDIVPYAWDVKTLDKLFTLYAPLLPTLPLIALLIKMKRDAKGKKYKHVDEKPTILEGNYKWLAVPYIMQAIYQHVQGYPELMDMKDEIPIRDLLPLPEKIQEIAGPLLRYWI